jgi:hypothetical protein
MMQLINAMLEQSWNIIFASPAQHSEHAVDLEALGVSSKSIELNNTSFDEFVTELKPNIVIFDRFMMEEQFGWRVEKFCPSAMRILNTEDLHSLREARQTAIKKGYDIDLSSPAHITRHLHSDLAIREIAAIFRSDLTLMISPVEIELLVEHFQVPKQQLMYLPFMLPALSGEHIKELPSFDEREHFISIGNFRHAPNWDVVLQLKQHIWPLIRKKMPKAEIHIYGAYPPPKATQLHNPKQGFLVKGWAEDAHNVIKNARVLLAPIRFGAGIKGKFSDAMTCGTPSITTSIGSEGMLFDQTENPVWPGSVISLGPKKDSQKNSDADIYTQFAETAIQAYQDEAAYTLYQENGFKILNQQYDKTYWQPQLIDRLKKQKDSLPQFRQTNFVGLMLRHHSMKSTQYMAQWIEAKNKV